MKNLSESMFQQGTDANQSAPFQQFTVAIQRLAQMQGASVDVLHLNALSDLFDQEGKGDQLELLRRICQRMGFKKATRLERPDRVSLPLLCHVQDIGWGLVIDCDPHDQWLVATPAGNRIFSTAALRNRVALLQVGPSVDLGLGFSIFRKKTEGLKFFAHVQDTLSQYRYELIEACIASAFIGFLALATSLFSMQVYDRVIPTRGEYTLAILSLGVLISILIELAMKFARSHIMDYVVVGLDNRLSREIFHRLLSLRVDQVPASVGSLAGQLRGYEQVRGFYTSSTLFTLIDLPLALLFLITIVFIASPWVALVPFVFGGIALQLGLSIRKKTMLQAKEGATFSNLKTGLLVEAIEGIETIKAGSGGWKFLSRWIGVNTKTIHSDLKMRSISDSVGYYTSTVQQISYAGLVVVGALMVMQGHMTMGALIACSILSGRILAPITAVPGILIQHAHAQAALEGLEKLYQLKTDHHGVEQPLVPSSVKGHFVLNDIKFSYGNNPPVLIVPHLEIQPHERIAVLGPIGAGKSTLLRLLSGLYHPQEGRVLLDQLDIAHIHRQVLSQNLGYLQQDHRLFQGSLRENLLIGLPDPGDDVLAQVMQRTGMDRLVAMHPKGLERPIMEGGRGLSGGQKQLVAFTRLVLCAPPVMLLDEPTSTMDDEQERRCLQVLSEEAQSGKAMVIVTHKSSILPLVTRIIVIAGSSIIMDGPRDAVMQKLNPNSAQKHPQPPSSTSAQAQAPVQS